MNTMSQTLARKIAFLKGEGWERVMTRTIVVLFFYSLFVAYIGKDSQPALLQTANGGKEFDGMLIRTNEGYDFYDFTPMNYDQQTTDIETDETQIEKEQFTYVSIVNEELMDTEGVGSSTGAALDLDILAPSTLIANDGSYARIYDTNDRRNYDLIRDQGNMQSVTFTNRKDIVFTSIENNGDFSLRHYFASCKEPEIYSLRGADTPAKNTLEAVGLPIQKEILLSTSQVHMLVLDHVHASRARIVNLISQDISEVMVPRFSDSQIHYAPTFIGDDNIAFSILDRGKTATVLYSLKTKESQVISQNFSDAIYLSRTGIITMLQSFHTMAGNIPYGSQTILKRQAVVNRQDVVGALGTDESWKSAFTEPSSEVLTFKTDAKDIISDIREPESRRILLQFWSALYDPFVPKEMELKIVTWENTGTKEVGTMQYLTDGTHPYLTWNINVTPLLRALGLPESLIASYNDHHARAINSFNGKYEFVEMR